MEEYYFIFYLALIWTGFAAIQDLRTREVANWLSFSLITFSLAYRMFYSAIFNNWNFFLFGLVGFGAFYLVALTFYYGGIFGGGDAKLLMGIGTLLPVVNLSNTIFYLGGFIFLLFLFGSVYSLAYSVFLVGKNREQFKASFFTCMKKYKSLLISSIFVLAILSIFLSFYLSIYFTIFFSILFLATPFLFIYLRALEESCMIKLIAPKNLSVGDWLAKNVFVRNRWIKKSAHGLSIEDIRTLRRARKKVMIKEGIPFVPAFFISLSIMGFAAAILGLDLSRVIYYLF